MNLNRLRLAAPRAVLISSLFLFGGCLSLDVEQPRGISVLVIVSGQGQTIPIGSTTSLPLVVRGFDSNAAPVPGETVTWTVTQGTGTVSAATTLTDETGQTSVKFNPGATTGENRITATTSGLLVTFILTVVAAG
jgi:hypothetical protein